MLAPRRREGDACADQIRKGSAAEMSLQTMNAGAQHPGVTFFFFFFYFYLFSNTLGG